MKRAAPWLVLALILGAVLRLWNLGPQILGDDELHGVRAALANPVSHILVTYQKADNTIPVSAAYRLLLDSGARLTEWTVRLPAVLAGLLLLLVAPWWVARRLGARTAVVFAFLLSVSPGLVFYSRIARSYAPIVLLTFGALACFDAWWRQVDSKDSRSWRLALAYVGLAALAVWFHLGAAPFVAAPFLFAAGDAAVRKDRRSFLALVGLGCATVLSFLVFLAPAWGSLGALIQEKQGALHLSWGLARSVMLLGAGSGRLWVLILVGAAAVSGFARLLRTDRSLALLSATAVVGHLAGLLYLAPMGHESPLVSFRYVLIALPWVLLWVAAAFNREGKIMALAAGLLIVCLIWAGPFLRPHLRRSSFAHHNDYMALMWRRPVLRPQQVPRFYTELAKSGEPGAVLEYPWVAVWRLNRAFYLYEEIHGREVVVAPARALLADDRLAFHNMVPGSPEGFLASRARWLVVHRNLAQEEERIEPPMEIEPRHRNLFRTFGHRMTERLRSDWGAPDYLDRRIAAWDLDRVRASRQPAQTAAR